MHSRKLLLLYIAIACFLSLAWFIPPMPRETLLQQLASFQALAQAKPVETALVFLVASTTLAYLAFPSMPIIYMAAGYYMDSVSGGVIVLVGSAFGGLGAFLLYRQHILRRPEASWKHHSPLKIWLTLLGLRLSPLVPAPLVNFLAAFFNASILQHMTTTLLGSAPLILFYVQIGRQGNELLYGQMPHWWHFSGFLIILAISSLLTAIGPWKSLLNEIKQLKDAAFASVAPSSRTSA
jgi:uncharacterized membrane protein YdjX (TVP38/TMEM64 family)